MGFEREYQKEAEVMRKMARSSNECMAQEETRDIREVTRAMNSLFSAIERYDNISIRLSDRIASITSPAPPTCADKSKHGYSTGLASAIHDAGSRLHEITNNLEDMYSRIEL